MRGFHVCLSMALWAAPAVVWGQRVVDDHPVPAAVNRLRLAPEAPPAGKSKPVYPASQTEYVTRVPRQPHGVYEESILARQDVFAYYGEWPLLFGRPYWNPVEQPTGRMVRQLGPNKWESTPVYGEHQDRTEPLWKIARREEVALPGAGESPLPPKTVERDPLARAVTAFRIGRYAEADRWAAQLTDERAKHGPAELLRVQTSLAQGKYQDAAAHLSRAMQLLPPDKWGLVAANYRDYYGRQQDLADHLRTLEGQMKRKDATAEALTLLGFQYAMLGYTTDARQRWERVLLLDPQHADATRLLREFRGSSRREF